MPDNIGQIYLPLPVLEATSRVMRQWGDEGRECYVWWGGYFQPNGAAQVVTALWPDVATEYGRIHLGQRDLLALHEKLRVLDLVLTVELHTHPPLAGGQNDVDAANASASYNGFISIVVPDFAAPRFHDIRSAYVYEYRGGGRWHELDREEIGRKFVIEEAVHRVQP